MPILHNKNGDICCSSRALLQESKYQNRKIQIVLCPYCSYHVKFYFRSETQEEDIDMAIRALQTAKRERRQRLEQRAKEKENEMQML